MQRDRREVKIVGCKMLLVCQLGSETHTHLVVERI